MTFLTRKELLDIEIYLDIQLPDIEANEDQIKLLHRYQFLINKLQKIRQERQARGLKR